MGTASRGSPRTKAKPRRTHATKRRASGSARPRARFGWSRRLGVALAVLLVGASAVIAGQFLQGEKRSPADAAATASATPINDGPPPPAPTLLRPPATLVTTALIDVDVALPAQLVSPRPDGYRLRVYVNDEIVRERRLPDESPTRVREVPLQQGENRITAAIVAPSGGEGLHSSPLLVTRDDQPPVIHIVAPADGERVFLEELPIRGRTEPGAHVSLTNTATGEELELSAGSDGRFAALIPLATGSNTLSLRAQDAAGNRSRASISVVRARSAATVVLEVRPESVRLQDLPLTLTLLATVSGVDGRPVDGAEVTFSMSVPGQSTMTYGTTTDGGRAAWYGLRVPRDGALAGQGLATVMVTLGEDQDSLTLRASATIRFD
jgi:hypothetical protein